ncbi:hypothetical protein NUACC21_52210 [Scytonema sp. NUACC21]
MRLVGSLIFYLDMGHMWQKEKQISSAACLYLLLVLATTPAAALFVPNPARAQSSANAPASPLPKPVSSDTKVRIDGSEMMSVINPTLKKGFEKQFSGVEVEVASNGTETALKALQDGKIDIAAIGRGLTPEEKAQGLELIRLRREKIAIVVGKDNPFKGSLTVRQFARIFRGRITDWSRFGTSQGKIRFIDRPESSEIRQSFRGYSIFQATKFSTGSNAIQLAEDNPLELVKQLGKDGISYIKANQVSKLQGVRVVPIHGTLPDDPKYPFSLPLVYVYKKNPSPTVSRFLSFATTPSGKQAIEDARVAEAVNIASGRARPVSQAISISNVTVPTPTFSPSTEATPAPTVETAIQTTATSDTASPNSRAFVPPSDNRETRQEITPLLWLLVPLSIGGLILWRSFTKRFWRDEETQTTPELTSNPPLEENGFHPISPSETVTNGKSTLLPNFTHLATVNGGAGLAGGTTLVAGTTLQSKTLKTVSDGITEERSATANGTVVQPQVTQVQALYPTLPDVWDELASDEQALLTQEATSSTPVEQQKPEEVKSETDSIATQPATSATNLPEDDTGLDLDWEAPVAVVTPLYSGLPDIAAVISSVQQETTAPADLSTDIYDIEDTQPEVIENLTGASHSLERSIILTPRTPQWAYTFWNIPDSQREQLRQLGGSQLAVRLYDVTDLDLSYQSPQLVQQYECEETVHNCYVAIPASDRDYTVEIGYITDDDRWLLLDRSETVRISNRPQSDFWFVADAELIIHGATEPGSTLTIDGHPVKLRQDGTFHLRIPFTEGAIAHHMKATSTNGEQAKTLQVKFVKEIPDSEK